MLSTRWSCSHRHRSFSSHSLSFRSKSSHHLRRLDQQIIACKGGVATTVAATVAITINITTAIVTSLLSWGRESGPLSNMGGEVGWGGVELS